jgi:hypothetical protein
VPAEPSAARTAIEESAQFKLAATRLSSASNAGAYPKSASLGFAKVLEPILKPLERPDRV